jgi:hypothetical protein
MTNDEYTIKLIEEAEADDRVRRSGAGNPVHIPELARPVPTREHIDVAADLTAAQLGAIEWGVNTRRIPGARRGAYVTAMRKDPAATTELIRRLTPIAQWRRA